LLKEKFVEKKKFEKKIWRKKDHLRIYMGDLKTP